MRGAGTFQACRGSLRPGGNEGEAAIRGRGRASPDVHGSKDMDTPIWTQAAQGLGAGRTCFSAAGPVGAPDAGVCSSPILGAHASRLPGAALPPPSANTGIGPRGGFSPPSSRRLDDPGPRTLTGSWAEKDTPLFLWAGLAVGDTARASRDPSPLGAEQARGGVRVTSCCSALGSQDRLGSSWDRAVPPRPVPPVSRRGRCCLHPPHPRTASCARGYD